MKWIYDGVHGVTQKSIKLLFFLSVLLLSGCKLAVINVEGGEVQSTGSGTCVAGTVCLIDVADTNFSETFTAVPDEGWYFHKWNQGGRFFCGNSFNPECSLSFEGLQGEENVESLVASSEVFYLMPVFKRQQDIISVNDKEWLQPSLFRGLSWNEINEVCPAGICSGVLNGYDMNGWTWASVDDIYALFNYYIGTDLLGPAQDSYREFDFEWAPAFFSDGWVDTDMDDRFEIRALEGWLRNLYDDNSASIVFFIHVPGPGVDISYKNDRIEFGYDEVVRKIPDRGAWFYRTP